jgi:hypothetical protein
MDSPILIHAQHIGSTAFGDPRLVKRGPMAGSMASLAQLGKEGLKFSQAVSLKPALSSSQLHRFYD